MPVFTGKEAIFFWGISWFDVEKNIDVFFNIYINVLFSMPFYIVSPKFSKIN